VKLVVRGFLALFGLALLLLGAYLAFGLGGEARANAARAAAMEPATAASLAAIAPGAEVLVEATLSPDNPAHFRDFVAYVRQEFRGADANGDETWVNDEEVLPPLRLDAGGPVQVSNAGYDLLGSHERWQEEGLEWSRKTGEGSKRYFGLVAGRPVMVLGQVGADGDVVARLVYGGSRAEYIAAQQQSAGWLPWFGGLFGLIGAGLIFLGLWALRRWR
jgi:hypothetical protein